MNVESLNQFATLIFCNSEECFLAKQRLLQRLSEMKTINGSFMSMSEWEKELTDLLMNNADDYVIYAFIRNIILGKNLENDILEINEKIPVITREQINRAEFMSKKLLSCIPPYIKKKATNFLDYGCAEGAITGTLRKQLGFSKELCYGADIRTFYGENDFTFIQLTDEGDLIPNIRDKSIDIIFVSMVLHHIENIPQTLIEFKRILKKNGIIIIREHHCENIYEAVFLDIVHGLYSLSLSDPIEDKNFIKNYKAWYKTREEWNDIMSIYGFGININATNKSFSLYSDAIGSIYNENKNKFNRNLVKAYYAVYTLKKN